MLTRAALVAAAAALCSTSPARAQAPPPAVDGPIGSGEVSVDLPVEVAPPSAFASEAALGALPGEKLVVMDPTTSRALLVDPERRTVLARVPTGALAHEVAVSPDGRRAYVANYGVPDGAAGTAYPIPEASITVVDLETGIVLSTLRPFRTAAGEVLSVRYRGLHDIQVGAGGSRLYLTSEADSSVLELDAHTGEVLMQWKTGAAMSHTLATSRDARKLFIANRWSDSLTVIDRLTVTAHRIPTGREPEGLALSPSGQELWVGNRGDHTITVIDTRRQRRLATLDAGGRDPVRLAFRPDGAEVWVANASSRELAVFDARGRELLATVPLDVAPRDLVFAPDGRRLYVTAPDAGRVLVVDARWHHVLDSFGTGGSPSGLAWGHLAPAVAAGQ